MSNDKRTIGIAKQNHGLLQRLVHAGRFVSELDAAKFAMAYAVHQGASAGRSDGTDTKWNVGSVDPLGNLREMIMSLYPNNDEPYRLMEYLINTGLQELGRNSETPDVFGALFLDEE